MPNRHLAQSKKKPLLKKARVTEKDDIKDIVIAAARKVLADIQQRSTEAIKAIDQHDYLVVLGALAGLEEQIRFVTVRLMVLREVEQIQKQKSQQRRKP
jgi:predicted transcriptional regulator